MATDRLEGYGNRQAREGMSERFIIFCDLELTRAVFAGVAVEC